MSFLQLCDNDPLLSLLRDVFDCNPIGVPDGRMRPLTVVASDRKKSSFRGELVNLLVGHPTLDIPALSSDMANLSVKRTNGVTIELGLKILDGFLSGFGLPTAGIKATFNGVTQVSFAFKEVRRQYVDINLLGKKLARHKVDVKSPAAAIFSGDAFELLVVDSVIQSRDFVMNVDKQSDAGFLVNIPIIQQIVQQANVGVSVNSATKLDISFTGPKYLTFAFACVRLYVDGAGVITSMPPADKVPALRGYLGSSEQHIVHYTPDRVLLSPSPALLSFDE